jgi:hypothetical protein
MGVSVTTVNLLRAAAEIAGGNKALAERMGIAQAQLARFMADSPPLPDSLLLRAVDIILANRQSAPSLPARPIAQLRGSTDRDG